MEAKKDLDNEKVRVRLSASSDLFAEEYKIVIQ